MRFTPKGADTDALFDIKVVYQQDYTTMNVNDAPKVFRPNIGDFGLMDYEKVYTKLEGSDIFEEHQVSRDGAIVIVRPDMYVASILPLDATGELAGFFEPILLEQR